MPSTQASKRWDPDATGGGGLPTAQQQLLVGGALFEPESAQAAWQAWRAGIGTESDTIQPANIKMGTIDPAGLEPGSYRLLPLVHHNLTRNSVDDPALAGLKEYRFQTMVKNQSHLYNCARLLETLHRAGIETLVLKGAALVGDGYYPDASLRLMDDFDVLVRRKQAAAALAVLARENWRAGKLDNTRLNTDFLFIRHAQNFDGPNLANFDLHWHVLSGSMDIRLDEQLWENAWPLTIHNVQTHTLAPTDMLLHICVHGAAWAPIPPIRWIADAVMILRAAQIDPQRAIDWARLLHLASTFQLSLTLQYTLGYLQKHILPHTAGVVPIPDHVAERLAQAPVSSRERWLFRVYTQRSTKLGQLPLLWAGYRYYVARYNMLDPDERPAHRLRFPGYIATYFGYRGLPEVLRWGVNRSGRRIRRMFSALPVHNQAVWGNRESSGE